MPAVRTGIDHGPLAVQMEPKGRELARHAMKLLHQAPDLVLLFLPRRLGMKRERFQFPTFGASHGVPGRLGKAYTSERGSNWVGDTGM